MKDNTKKTIEGFGKFFGASAYGFTHMPVLVAREIKEMRMEKKKRTAKKVYARLKKYTEERCGVPMIITEEEYLKFHGML